jgi:uncharacterized membrane protein HdeD (DUF308 family)
MSHKSKQYRQRKIRLFTAAALLCGLLLCGFYGFHGIQKSDSFYIAELILAWVLAVSGIYTGLKGFKHGGRTQRTLVSIAFALILSCILSIILFDPDPSSPPASPPMEGFDN